MNMRKTRWPERGHPEANHFGKALKIAVKKTDETTLADHEARRGLTSATIG